MTQEEISILLKDLCARLPYGVKINVDDIGLFIPRLKYIDGIMCHFYECAWIKFIDEIKPYLRPMSSMTEEEKSNYHNYRYWIEKGDVEHCTINMMDWLNSHHFDYRGLIPMGLALEAPEDMYRIKSSY